MAEGRIERRIVTALFADLVGFTTLGERLDAEDVAAIQDAYFASVRETVGRYGGQLEKFIGDAAVAAFGVPRAHDDDAERAVRAGLAIVSAVEHLGARLGFDVDELRVRVGVATGEVAHAVGGPDAGRITGDTVNTAARLQTAAPPGRVLVGETTALAIAEVMDLEPAQSLPLKGKGEPVRAHLVAGIRPERSRDAAMGRLQAPTVGREEELGLLRSALDGVRDGGPGEAWLVVAPPGVGKSRLLRELVAHARRTAAGTAVVRCRLEPEAPFAAVADLLRALLGGGDGHGEGDGHGDGDGHGGHGSALEARLVAGGLDRVRAPVVAGEVRDLLDRSGRSGSSRAARFEAWADALDALPKAAPHVWVLEDLHWGSADLLAFVAALAARRTPGRLLVMSTRPSLLGRAPDLARADDASIRRLELRPLAATAAKELVDRLVRGALPPALLARIAERADGNPLFIEELLRAWVSTGALVPSDDGSDGWRLAVQPDLTTLPATVQAIYAAQLDDLPDGPRDAARRGSVSGRRVPVDALPALDVADLENAVDVLVRRAIVQAADPDPIAGSTVAYRHALLRDAGYASLARAERARLHLRLARWLEETAGERAGAIAAAIAAHWESAVANTSALATLLAEEIELATARATAARWLETAAAGAMATSAWESAADLIERALAVTDADRVVDRARLLARLADVRRLAGGLAEAAERYAAAVDLVAPVLDDDAFDPAARGIFAGAAARLAEVRIEQLEFAAAEHGAAAAIERLGDVRDAARIRVEIEHSRAIAALRNDYAEAVVRAEDALAAARDTGDAELIRRARAEYVGCLHEDDRATPEDWAAVADEARAAGDWPEVVACGTNAAMLRLSSDPGRVAGDVAPLAVLADAHRLPEDACWLDYVRAEADLVIGRWADVLEEGRRVLEIGTAHGYDRAVVRTLHCLVPVAARRGADELLAQCATWYDRRRGTFPRSPYGLVYQAAVDVDFARAGLITSAGPGIDELRAGLGLGEGGPSWLMALDTLVDAWLAQPDFDSAAEAARLIEASAGGTPLGRLAVSIIQLRVAAATAASDGPTVAARVTELAGDAAGFGAPWWEARALALAGTPEAAGRVTEIQAMLGLRPQAPGPRAGTG